MSTLVVQSLVLSILSFSLWRLRKFLSKSDITNLPGPASQSFFKGNFDALFDLDHGWDFHKHLAQQYGRVMRTFGLFNSNDLYVFDPKALHHIVVKDQHIFEESRAFVTFFDISLGPGLLSTLGDHHKKQRKMMNPVFSIAHMRNMMPMFDRIAKKLGKAIESRVADGPREIDILNWMSRTALEMIGQSGFGYSFDDLVEDEATHRYCAAVKSFVPASSEVRFLREYVIPVVRQIGTPKFQAFIANYLPGNNIVTLRNIIKVMDETAIEIFQEKKQAMEQGGKGLSNEISGGKDIMSILMKANSEASEADKLPDEEVIGQISTFAFAGTDTTSNALSRTLYLLTQHPEIQNKLREELMEAKRTYGDVPYDELVELPYLDAVCRETLRLHPPIPILVREALQDASVPLLTPVKGLDGREMDSILVPKGTRIFMSLWNANRDVTLWGPDAEEWKPERWLSPLPQTLLDAKVPGIYSNLMTFLGGGRACIGFKFSQLEMKAVLSVLVSKFRFSPSETPIQWKMTGVVTPAVKGSPVPQLPIKVELIERSG